MYRGKFLFRKVDVYLILIIVVILHIPESALKVSVLPKSAVIREIRDHLSVTCQSDIESTRCQFLVRDYDRSRDYAIRDLNDTTREYYRGGIGTLTRSDVQGNCVLYLSVHIGRGRYIVGCRRRNVDTEWQYDFMSFRIQERSSTLSRNISIKASVSTNSQVHRLGEEVDLTCEKFPKEPLLSCLIALDGRVEVSHSDSFLSVFPNATSRECSSHITRVEERHNGLLWCETETVGRFGHDVMPFIVAKEPTVYLDIDVNPPFNVGDTFSATCTVTASRPAPSITWYLNDRIYTQEAVTTRSDAWMWPWSDHDVTQTVNVTVSQADKEQQISCRVTILNKVINGTYRFRAQAPKTQPPITTSSTVRSTRTSAVYLTVPPHTDEKNSVVPSGEESINENIPYKIYFIATLIVLLIIIAAGVGYFIYRSGRCSSGDGVPMFTTPTEVVEYEYDDVGPAEVRVASGPLSLPVHLSSAAESSGPTTGDGYIEMLPQTEAKNMIRNNETPVENATYVNEFPAYEEIKINAYEYIDMQQVAQLKSKK